MMVFEPSVLSHQHIYGRSPSSPGMQAKYGGAAVSIFAAAKRVFAALPLAARIAGEFGTWSQSSLAMSCSEEPCLWPWDD